MSSNRLLDYIDQIQTASERAIGFVSGMTEEQFQADIRTQMAVTMALVLIGEGVARIASTEQEFLRAHPEIAWAKIQGMRNLVVHDDDKIELPIVWRAVRDELPSLVSSLEMIRHWRAEGE